MNLTQPSSSERLMSDCMHDYINAQSASLHSLVATEITLLAQQYCVSWEVFETLVQRCCVIWEKCSTTIFLPLPSPSNKAGWAYRSKLLRDKLIVVRTIVLPAEAVLGWLYLHKYYTIYIRTSNFEPPHDLKMGPKFLTSPCG